ncbi:MAG: Fe(2+)-trafficking protein [Gemmataceae bacterium]
MSQLQEQIAQFRKMADDDPDNELGHFRLGQLLMEDGQVDEAVKCFYRTLEISPYFSKVYQLLATCLLQLGQRDEAVKTLQQGFAVADERGDRKPLELMADMLRQLGAEVPESKQSTPEKETAGAAFRCQRPGCPYGSRAQQLAAPPFNDELGQRIYTDICAGCWNAWFRDYSIKVINELRLDLSLERGQAEYDRHMREFLGLD